MSYNYRPFKHQIPDVLAYYKESEGEQEQLKQIQYSWISGDKDIQISRCRELDVCVRREPAQGPVSAPAFLVTIRNKPSSVKRPQIRTNACFGALFPAT